MTHDTTVEDDDDDEDWSQWEDDDWEDTAYLKTVAERLPGWFIMKMESFNRQTFQKVEVWLRDNVKYGGYETLGWASGCSYSVGVAFEHGKDAMLFKLRWR